MIDDRIWDVLDEDFSALQIWDIKQALKIAEDLGGWGLDIVPQTLFEREECSVCATFYSYEVAEMWIYEIGLRGKIFKYMGSDPRNGYRACISFKVLRDNPYWPGW